ncbi:hypothetical protein ASPFODRAFT_549853 [Aspergillus luchuensis CBS 106.47]|uniref:Uncharacterized protein n=1 Tax=Aspergillus luchuensis (strain CBS 106.47) TaxID=1137211 RepID=A0A1M3TP44_ASPLC|nr:hypothetical protein ASPFODRAFT_549853 [Aspergillus luchuensis CBS 106.47]
MCSIFCFLIKERMLSRHCNLRSNNNSASISKNRQTKTNGPNTNHYYPRDTPLCRHCGKSRHKHMLSSHYPSSPVSSFPILQLPSAMR